MQVIYTHAEWENIVAATQRLSDSIGHDGLFAQSRTPDASGSSET